MNSWRASFSRHFSIIWSAWATYSLDGLTPRTFSNSVSALRVYS